MKHQLFIVFYSLLLGAPVFAQEAGEQKPSPERVIENGERKLDNSKRRKQKGLGEKIQLDKSQAPAVDLKNNPRLQKSTEKAELKDVSGAGDGSDAAAEPLTEPVVLAPTTVVAPAFVGSPRMGLVEIERLARDGRGEEASALAHLLMEQVASTTGDEELQAELSYAAGVSDDMASRRIQSVDGFRTASVLAGPGELRLEALYNQAALHIEHGEELYERVEEIKAEALQLDRMKSPSPEPAAQDTLPAARDQFQKARDVLISRLKIDWRDRDARANIELVQRRLDKLDSIESKRDEAESNQESDKGQETEKTEEGEDTDKGDTESDDENEEEGKTGKNSSNENNEEAQEADPQEGEGAQDGDQDPNPSSESQEDPQAKKEEEQETGREDDQTESEQGGAEADPEMSQEQVKLILDRLSELDHAASRLRVQLYKSARIAVDRDW